MTFPVGYHSLHPDVSMNFQMNRWYSCVGCTAWSMAATAWW